MRAVRWIGLGVGALLVGRGLVGCASEDAQPFDPGPLPDVVVGHDAAHDGATSDGAPHPGGDAGGDTSLPSGDDGATGDDASTADADDGAIAIDASDAAQASDSGAGSDASDAGAPADAGDDATDSGAALDASPLACTGYDAGTNPITNVVATAGGNVVANNGTVPAADAVTLTATTTPELATDVQIGYCVGTNGCNAVYVTMTAVVDAGLATDTWTGDIPAQTAATHVAWWVQTKDTCGPNGSGQEHYWSNFGNNFHYTTQ